MKKIIIILMLIINLSANYYYYYELQKKNPVLIIKNCNISNMYPDSVMFEMYDSFDAVLKGNVLKTNNGTLLKEV